MPYELFVGLRYTWTRRRDNFVSTISIISMAGIALSIAALIVVLSVVNGFEREFRERLLTATAHVQVSDPGGPLGGWREVARICLATDGVTAVEPYVDAQVMLSTGALARGALLRGIDPQLDRKVVDLAAHLRQGQLDDLQAGSWHVILGRDLAAALGARVGDRLELVSPAPAAAGGLAPRLHEIEVVGIVHIGLYQYDSVVALMHLADVAAVQSYGDKVSGLRLRLADPMQATILARQLHARLPEQQVSPWTRGQGNLFQAVRTSKTLLAVILSLIVGVAAFNIVATLVMAVVDKEPDIAILRTLGATRSAVQRIFMVQGFAIGLIGTVLGVMLGLVLAANVGVIIPAIEHVLGIQFLSAQVYQIDELPVEIRAADVIATAACSLAMGLLATLYPSWRAAQVAPAAVLRDE